MPAFVRDEKREARAQTQFERLHVRRGRLRAREIDPFGRMNPLAQFVLHHQEIRYYSGQRLDDAINLVKNSRRWPAQSTSP